ncbi:error-prone DNA polymerase [Achromobacter sp. F4_2707]|uniref:error-prone DNA polymerase n=1 Tax=Achromobacter sp. F4_2707 TaxID=3114286 RepID=UPI0039C60DD3
MKLLPSFLSAYAELDCISNFSFLTGASHPEELIQRAAGLGYQALALADECSLAGVVRAHQEAQRHALHFITGSRFQLEEGMQIIVLACNLNGYGNLSEIITLARQRSPKGEYRLSLADIAEPPVGFSHLRGLSDCLVIFKPEYDPPTTILDTHLHALSGVFPQRLWLGAALHYGSADARHQATLHAAGARHGLPLVALGGVEMHRRSRQPLHDTLAAIRRNQPVTGIIEHLHPNAERHLRSRLRLANLYPGPWLQETLRISQLCQFSLDEIRVQYQYPKEIVPAGLTPRQYLRREALAGAKRRYPEGVPAAVIKQVETELSIIAELAYESYFLTVYDIVKFARQRGILCQGRGSAANSAVCYCLGITEVDPSSGNSLFARFISRARNEPPDIDVDFEHQRREEVIQYIYQRYGRDRSALTAVAISYRHRSALRDVGKALGVPPDHVDQTARSFHYWSGKKDIFEKIQSQGLPLPERQTRLWASLTETLKGFPRHLSQHPGGFVISHGKLSRLVPIENAAMPDRSIVQWDKDDLDAMGLLKVDVLGLGMLSVLQRCLQLASQQRGRPFALQDIPNDDAATFEMIRRADTIGVFQIESRAQMSMLPRLQPRKFYDLVVQVAIVRPGPIQGGMVHPYLRRRQGLEDIGPPYPKLQKVLERTLGVPIFQEQAMQIAMVAADFSADEADELRRAMAAWRRRGSVERFRQRLLQGMKKNGYKKDFAEQIFKQLEGFGEYGFPESHAASFAKLAYYSAWFKCHEPAAFLAALLNSQPMGFYAPSQLVQAARRQGVEVRAVDVQHSRWETTLEAAAYGAHPALPDRPGNPSSALSTRPPSPAVRLGLNQITGLSEQASRRIEHARQGSPFSSAQDLATRASLDRHEMNALAAANALQALSGDRRQAQWQSALKAPKGLLRGAPIHEAQHPLLPPMSEGEHIVSDYQKTGLTLRRHPLALLRARLHRQQFVPADTLLADWPDRRLARACGLVTTRQRPGTAKGVVFVTLEDESGHINVIVRPDLAEKQHAELVGAQLLGVYGVWQRQQSVCHLVARRLVDLSHLLGALRTSSRDFH